MSSDDFQVQNIYKYCRKTYKKNRRGCQENEAGSTREDVDLVDTTPRTDIRSDGCAMDSPGCSCDMDPEGELASILHKKYPVISLAQQQLQRLLSGTDRLLCDNTRCCRSVYDFLCICKELLLKQNCQCTLVILIALGFFLGLILGAATCGAYLGRFNSPILSCIDSFFVQDNYPSIKDSFYCIV